MHLASGNNMILPKGFRVYTVGSIKERWANREGTIVSIYNDGTVVEYGLSFKKNVTAFNLNKTQTDAWFLPVELRPLKEPSNTSELRLSSGFQGT